MPGPRQSVDVLKAKGKKHLSKAEEAQRRDMEVQVEAPSAVTPPKWLKKKHHSEFLAIGQILLNAGLYKELDRDVLAQYFVCREHWLHADKEAAKAIKEKDDKGAQAWTGIQATYFKQARQCASAMGLDVTARCRLIVPDGMKQAGEEDNPFLSLIRGGKAANG